MQVVVSFSRPYLLDLLFKFDSLSISEDIQYGQEIPLECFSGRKDHQNCKKFVFKLSAKFVYKYVYNGATAVQIAYKQKGRMIKIIHVGSAHPVEELEMLLALARKRVQANRLELFTEEFHCLN